MLPFLLQSVREKTNVASLLMQPKAYCPFFIHSIHKKQKKETTWETCGAPRYRLLIKHRSHSVLIQLLLPLTAAVTQCFSKQHFAGITSNDLFHKDDQSGPFRFPADFWKGDATFPRIISYNFENSIFKKLCLIKLTIPGLGSASTSHHHTYLLHVDQPSNWLLNVWPCELSTVLHQNQTVLQRCKISWKCAYQ